MRIRNNKGFNVSINAMHTGAGGSPKRITIPAGATLELSDSDWKENFADVVSVKSSLVSKALEITKAVVLTEAESAKVNASALADAKKLIDQHSKSAAATEKAAKKSAK